ncbi:hypothetical protein EDEG_02378 [Edhazardia aedis USNM 41457]|uniref:Uncharacterized protein n=1 Tax=Edhazardia aedis (strain USNM 41457) TaxID=1003232 RepID=J8ZUB4_EDHAE|nr:hypothetical protein EDEG_02378 [Edhazardia aedis USNM 41457]|eukprot:EJW03263.1 hypothetical protein EDEG_02378 [Edhazardia aedis USNM 41457]
MNILSKVKDSKIAIFTVTFCTLVVGIFGFYLIFLLKATNSTIKDDSELISMVDKSFKHINKLSYKVQDLYRKVNEHINQKKVCFFEMGTILREGKLVYQIILHTNIYGEKFIAGTLNYLINNGASNYTKKRFISEFIHRKICKHKIRF